MLYAVIYAITECLFLAITCLDIVKGNFRKRVHLGVARIV